MTVNPSAHAASHAPGGNDPVTLGGDPTFGDVVADSVTADTLAPTVVPTITGDHVVDTDLVLKDLLTALATIGLIVDETAEV